MADAAVKWGVLGAGGFANNRFIPHFGGAKSAELHAIMVRDMSRAREIAQGHGAPAAYDSVEALLADDQVQVVYVCTPVHLHCEHVLAAARAGKHVLCEKPMARTEAECERMIRTCAREDVKLMMAFMNRFRPAHVGIREMIERGELGTILALRAQLASFYALGEGAWRQVPRLAGGGALYDLGSHALDLLCFLGGPVAQVSALVDTRVQDYEADDLATLLVRFESGAHGLMLTAFCMRGRASPVEVFGTEGSVVCRRTIGPFEQGEVVLFDAQGEPQALEFPPSLGYAEEIEHLSRCVLEGAQPSVTGHDGLHNVAIMRAAQESARTGRAIRL
jgi:predicted dehydrogenase